MDTSDLARMQELIYEYECDPNHVISQELIKVKQGCVMKYDPKTIHRKIRQVYRRLHAKHYERIEYGRQKYGHIK